MKVSLKKMIIYNMYQFWNMHAHAGANSDNAHCMHAVNANNACSVVAAMPRQWQCTELENKKINNSWRKQCSPSTAEPNITSPMPTTSNGAGGNPETERERKREISG